MSDGTGALSNCRGLPYTVEDDPYLFAKPKPVRCEYCSRMSFKLQSNCDGCGAALFIPNAMLQSLTAPALVYSKDKISDVQALAFQQDARGQLTNVQNVQPMHNLSDLVHIYR